MKPINYNKIKEYINSEETGSGCELLTTENEFEEMKIEQNKVGTQIILKIQCKCGNEFYRNFHNFKTSKINKCEKCKHNDIYPQERINKVIQLYENNYKMEYISNELHMKKETISNILKANNVHIRNNTDYKTSEELATTRKYSFNQNYFECIDDFDKAYWLGMIYADGNVYIPHGRHNNGRGARFEITLQDEDLYHLYNFRKCIEGDMPIKEKNVKRNDKIFYNHRLSLSSVKFVNDLIDKGCVPNKSLILKFPEEDKLPSKFYNSFIRGYFDGDGCIGFYPDKSNKKHMSILGTYDFLLKIKNILKNIGITYIGLHLPKDRNAWVLYIGSIDNLNKFFNFIYENNHYFLGRKYDKFINLLNYYDKDINISEAAKLFSKLAF